MVKLKFKDKTSNKTYYLVSLACLMNDIHLSGSETKLIVSMIDGTELDIAKSNQYKLVKSLTDKGYLIEGKLHPIFAYIIQLKDQTVTVEICLKN